MGYDNFAILTIGTGIGYSLAFHGTPINYPDKTYGLAGHILIDPDGPRCVSGHRGCAQCLTSDSIAEEYSQMIGKAVTFDDFGRDARAGTGPGHQTGEPHLLPAGHADRRHRQPGHAGQGDDRRRVPRSSPAWAPTPSATASTTTGTTRAPRWSSRSSTTIGRSGPRRRPAASSSATSNADAVAALPLHGSEQHGLSGMSRQAGSPVGSP